MKRHLYFDNESNKKQKMFSQKENRILQTHINHCFEHTLI